MDHFITVSVILSNRWTVLVREIKRRDYAFGSAPQDDLQWAGGNSL